MPPSDPMPPPPPPSASARAPSADAAPVKDYQEKYYDLKHRYWSLKQQLTETQAELQRSGERNRKLTEERAHLLNRIIELESPDQPEFGASAPSLPGQPLSSALPRSLLSERSRDVFTAAIREALEDVDLAEDPSRISTARNPAQPQPHSAAAQATIPLRKRERDEPVSTPPPRRGGGGGGDEEQPTPSKRRRVKGGGKGKDVPAPSPAPDASASASAPAPSPLTGKRIRIKPPVDAAAVAVANAALHAQPPQPPAPVAVPPQHQHQHQFLADPHAIRDPRAHAHAHSVSPLSSLASPNGEYYPPPSSTSMSSESGPAYPPSHLHPYPHPLGPAASAADAPPLPPVQSPPADRAHAAADHNGVPPAAAEQVPIPTPERTNPAEQRRPQRAGAKPKRLKAHTVTSKSHSIPPVPRDAQGGPVLPLNVGIMTVLNLGQVCLREHFHTERYIFPVGYEVTRRYLSAKDPHQEVTYHCTILDGGDAPKFQIVAADQPDKPIVAGTASGAWSVVVRAANHLRNRQHSNSVSGPDFFGLGQNTIKHLIQQLPGAERLRDYVWQTFVEAGDGRPIPAGRHALSTIPSHHHAAGPTTAIAIGGGGMDEEVVIPPPDHAPRYEHGYPPPGHEPLPPQAYRSPPTSSSMSVFVHERGRSASPPGPPQVYRPDESYRADEREAAYRSDEREREPAYRGEEREREPAFRSPPAGLAGIMHAYDSPVPVRAPAREWEARARSASASGSSAGVSER